MLLARGGGAPTESTGKQSGGDVNATNYNIPTSCHVNQNGFGKQQFVGMRAQGQVYFMWDDLPPSSSSPSDSTRPKSLSFPSSQWLPTTPNGRI
ncbi:hypothetical protein MVEN_01989500 [Mycena venus]|uniref:Uncharacterized protein n=1 Tax=Mycena venus TaxID=2733690 RepID=A0A8H6XDJ5_9AGAR|nr:hypothetical protein MVEN_01989500 [Mycena venus]